MRALGTLKRPRRLGFMATKTKLEEEVQEFLAIPQDERLAIARDIVRKLVETKRSKAAM